MNKQISYEALYVLLDQAGVAAPVGIDEVNFPLPANEMDRQKLLAVGNVHLAELEHTDLQESVQVIAGATAVVHAIFRTADKPDRHRWYFTNGTEFMGMLPEDGGVFTIDRLADKTELIAQIEQFIPLNPTPETLNYRIKVDQEDFQSLFDLATEWVEIPALDILEADGLDMVSAKDLFDSAVGSEWRGIIEFLTYDGKTITSQATVRALQGAEISWLIHPSADDMLIIETARQGLFKNALTAAL